MRPSLRSAAFPPLVRNALLLAGLLGTAAPVAAQNNGLDWLRFVGGPGDDVPGWPNGLEVAPNGDLWLTGVDSTTASGNLFVTRLSPGGTLLSNWTLGGSGIDRGNAIRIDPSGTLVHVGGWTSSPDFPTTANAVQRANGGGTDMFWLVLDAATGTIVYSTLLGGAGNDFVTDLRLDSSGGAWLYGATKSPNFPATPGAYQSTLRGSSDLALALLVAGAPTPLYATYFGGDGAEPAGNCTDLAVDASGVVTFYGDTDSTNLPVTANAWQPAFGGGRADGLLARLDPRRPPAQQCLYCSYVGWNGFDGGNGMAVEGDIVTIASFTQSTNLPASANAPQASHGGGTNDAYVVQLDLSQPPLAQLRFATYLGGGRSDVANDVAVDAGGFVTIVGVTGGLFPTTAGSFRSALQPVTAGNAHAFVARLDPVSGLVLYASYVGTDNPFGNTVGSIVRADGLGGAIVVGRTNAPNLPVTQGPPLNGTFDVWIARMSLLPRGVARVGDSSWRQGLARSFLGVSGMPISGSGSFALSTSGAPGTTLAGCGNPSGLLLVSATPLPAGLPVAGATLHLGLPIVLIMPTSAGRGWIPLPLTGVSPGARAAFQLAFCYPGCGLVHASNALEVVVQ